MLRDDAPCRWQWICSDRCCRNTSLLNTSLQDKERSRGSRAVSADTNVCVFAAG